MSRRSSPAPAGEARRRPRPRPAWALLFLLAWIAAPGAVRGDAIVLQNGETIEGAIVDATRNTVVVRRAIGGMHQMPLEEIKEVRLDLAGGERIAGQLLGWTDGVHELRAGPDILRISAGRILTREHRDQSTTPPQRLPRPLPPQKEESTVKVAGPAATAPAVTGAEPGRARAVTAEVASARNRAAAVGATGSRSSTKPPATTTPAVVGPTRTAGAPGATAPVEHPVVPAAPLEHPVAAATPAEHPVVAAALAEHPVVAAAPAEHPVTAAAPAEHPVTAAAPAEHPVTAADPVEHPVAAAAIAPAAAAAPEAGPASAAPQEASPAAIDAGEVAAAVVTTDTGEAKAGGDDQRLAVRGTVDPVEAGAAGIVFRIELSRPAEQPVVLIYGTVDGTAKAGKDYEPQQGVVTLTPGSRRADVRVPLLEHPHPQNAGFELFLMADPKVANVIDQRIAATIPGPD